MKRVLATKDCPSQRSDLHAAERGPRPEPDDRGRVAAAEGGPTACFSDDHGHHRVSRADRFQPFTDGRRREDPRLSRAWHDRSTGLVRGPAPQLASHDVVGQQAYLGSAKLPNTSISGYGGGSSGRGGWATQVARSLGASLTRRASHLAAGAHMTHREIGVPPRSRSAHLPFWSQFSAGPAPRIAFRSALASRAGGTWLHLAGCEGINCASEVGRFGGW